MKDIISALQWRYATKIYDTKKKLTDEQVNALKESIRLAPSSFGIEPWKIFVVTNPETRAKLREAGFGQSGITDSSHLFVFAAKTTIDESSAAEYIARLSKARNIPLEALSGYTDMIKGFIMAKNEKDRIEWSTHQIYLAVGMMIATASVMEIDTCPMEGFDPSKIDEILGLKVLGLESKVMVSAGFRSSEDQTSIAPKVRYSQDEVFVELK